LADRAPVCPNPNYMVNLALDRAFRLDLAGYLPWKSLNVSFLVHAAILLLLFLTARVAARQVPPSPAREALTQLFVPESAPPVPPIGPRNPSDSKPFPVPADESPAIPPSVAVDLSAVSLSFRPDVRNQLPAVVEAQGGVLALLDKDNPTIARYIFRPPLWQAEKVTLEVTAGLRLQMNPPQQWPVFREVAAREGLDLNAFLACAIFDISYRRCLQSALRERISPGSSGHVTAASLEFRVNRPCGVEVLDISVSPNPSAAR
jgi:hypothetical protein